MKSKSERRRLLLAFVGGTCEDFADPQSLKQALLNARDEMEVEIGIAIKNAGYGEDEDQLFKQMVSNWTHHYHSWLGRYPRVSEKQTPFEPTPSVTKELWRLLRP